MGVVPNFLMPPMETGDYQQGDKYGQKKADKPEQATQEIVSFSRF